VDNDQQADQDREQQETDHLRPEPLVQRVLDQEIEAQGQEALRQGDSRKGLMATKKVSKPTSEPATERPMKEKPSKIR